MTTYIERKKNISKIYSFDKEITKRTQVFEQDNYLRNYG